MAWLVRRWGWDRTHWARVVEYRKCFAFLHAQSPETLDALEISGEGVWNKAVRFNTYRSIGYPEYDLCAAAYPAQFDVVIADHVLPHVDCPSRAVENLYAMLRDGGHLIVTSSFLVRVEGSPVDCSRWTERGLKNLLVAGGFDPESVHTDSWGNRSCVKANFRRWVPYGFGLFRSLKNEPEFPVSVWAIARRQKDA